MGVVHIVDLMADLHPFGLFPGTKAAVRDLWRKADAGSFAGRFEAKVEPHGVVMLRITPQP